MYAYEVVYSGPRIGENNSFQRCFGNDSWFKKTPEL